MKVRGGTAARRHVGCGDVDCPTCSRTARDEAPADAWARELQTAFDGRFEAKGGKAPPPAFGKELEAGGVALHGPIVASNGPVAGSLSARARHLSIGLNNGKTVYRPETERADDEYGTLASVVQSWKDAGVHFVRQPGETDLMFPPQDASGERSARLPVVTGEADYPEFLAAVTSALRPGLEALFSLLCGDADAPAVVLTFLTLGGAIDGWSGGAQPGPFNPHTVVPANFADHVGVRMDDPNDGTEHVFPGGDGYDDYHQGTLDFTQDYKLAWVQWFGRAVGEMMVQLAVDLGVGPRTFGGKLMAIEIFNEVNTGSTIAGSYQGLDPEAADYWARGVARATLGLVEGFGGGAGDVPDLWLPSLASERDELTWAGFTSHFQLRLLGEIRAAFRALVGGDGLTSVFTNQDVHFYRFTEEQGVALAVTMADVIRGMEDNLHAEGYAGVEVSVCETGASVAEFVSDDVSVSYPQWVGRDIDAGRDERVVREEFQAMEVVRRLVVAAAAGATRVAWNSHIGLASAGSAFYGTGLRRDEEGTTAVDKLPRLGFGTIRRLCELFDTYGLRRGTIELPAPGGGGSYSALDPSDPANGVTVLRFQIARSSGLSSPYAWFVLYDSAAAYDEDRHRINLTYVATADGVYTTVPLVPDGITCDAAGPDDALLAVADIDWQEWSAGPLEGDVEMSDRRFPQMWFSQRDLAFDVDVVRSS